LAAESRPDSRLAAPDWHLEMSTLSDVTIQARHDGRQDEQSNKRKGPWFWMVKIAS